MRHVIPFAIAVMMATLPLSSALAQSKPAEKRTPPPARQARPAPQQMAPAQPLRRPVRPPQNQPAQRPPLRVRPTPSQFPPVQPRRGRTPTRPVQSSLTRNGQDWNQPGRNATNWQPRPGQMVIQPNRGWVPNRGHNYNSSTYLSIDIWAPATFGYGGANQQWNPSNWSYSVEDSLMQLIFLNERMSNSLRASFERQMSQGNLRSAKGGQNAWDRVQRMDESLERLRSETGTVDEAQLQGSAIESLSLAQQVSNSFTHHPEYLGLVRYEWNDLFFELNELARYYNEPAIR